MSEALRLNLGAGAAVLPGFTNLDEGYQEQGCCADGFNRLWAPAFPLPYAAETVDEVRASHLLEHFSHQETAAVLADWVRALKPGGLLRVAVPDFDRIIEKYQSGEPHPIEAWIMGGHQDERDHHGALFSADALAGVMQALGLVDIQRWESELPDCASYEISLNLQGRKPVAGEVPAAIELAEAVEPAREITIPAGAVKAVLSAPRLGFLDMMECAYVALAPLGISLRRGGGAFWHQSLTDMMEQVLDGTTRYILTLDYDTVFRQEDVLALVRIMETRPEIDFLCSLQARRGRNSPLFTIETGDKPDCGPREVRISAEHLAAETMPIASGHFGLTVLRVSALERLPRPWFQSTPDSQGSYGKERIDADIWFWRQANATGMVTHVANRVVVGHLELMVSWPDQSMQNRHQHVQEWNDSGKPVWAWR